MLYFQLIGPFGLTDDAGVDRRPKLLKARAILAVLATTPGKRHSRRWLQNLLWSDRGHAQGLASLRSALADIRRHLGPMRDCIQSDHSDVCLDVEQVEVDLDNAALTADPTACEFLQGFDVPHAEEFENWLRDWRRKLDVTRSADLPPPSSVPGLHGDGYSLNRIYLARGATPETGFGALFCDILVDCLAKSADDLGLADAIDGRLTPQPMEDILGAALAANCGMILIAEISDDPCGFIARIKAVETGSMKLFWSQSILLKNKTDINTSDPEIIGLVAQFIDVLTDHTLSSAKQDRTAPGPSLLGAIGMKKMFRLGAQNFEDADRLFAQAYERDPKGRYLAWRAYLRTFLLGELEFGSRDVVIEEGTDLKRRSLEEEPHNSMVLALSAHVETMLNRSYGQALELAERALKINRCNPLAWATYGVAEAYMGRPRDGFDKAKTASVMARSSCFSFQVDTWAGVTGVLAGDLDRARGYVEMSHAKAPSFAPPLRYLSALYCENGEQEKAAEAVEKLRIREPGFSFEALADRSYPSAGLRKAKLINALPKKQV